MIIRPPPCTSCFNTAMPLVFRAAPCSPFWTTRPERTANSTKLRFELQPLFSGLLWLKQVEARMDVPQYKGTAGSRKSHSSPDHMSLANPCWMRPTPVAPILVLSISLLLRTRTPGRIPPPQTRHSEPKPSPAADCCSCTAVSSTPTSITRKILI